MRTVDLDVAEGVYAQKQLLSPSRLIAWTHRRRLEAGLRLASRVRARHVLDYGCGDGTFLALLMRRPGAPARAVGVEIATDLVHDCQRRLEHAPALTFLHTKALEGPEHQGSYDLVVCMEVLEHVVDVEATIRLFARLMTTGGTLVVSVPVETGPAVLVKQSARRMAGWLGIKDYPGTTPYRWSELLSAVLAGDRQHIARPTYRTPSGHSWHDHKGFNWKVLRGVLGGLFAIEEVHTSPVPGVPPPFASQVWFLARNQSAGKSDGRAR